VKTEATSGVYEPGENILHLWYTKPVVLADEATIVAFFDEVESEWIRACPAKPYLLVNYANVQIAPKMTDVYARRIERFKALVVGTYRYGVKSDLTGVSVALGNMSLALQANIFPDEASARAAIRASRADRPR
jgi:hypothetical protein